MTPPDAPHAYSGDRQRFLQAAEPLRRPLLAHCYRMMGSIEDAEDLVQETMLKAWMAIDSYAGRASLRTWLFKIATNACLDALDKQARRALPATAVPASSPGDAFIPAVEDTPWLSPFPNSWLPDPVSGPEARLSQRESVRLAFVVALQRLPPRQRAVLLLRDVLGWRAREVSEQLEMSVAAANSALRRARATLGDLPPPASAPLSKADQRLLQRYVAAWESADIAALMQLLKDDAVFSMPPSPSWYRGRDDIRWFASQFLFGGDAGSRWRIVPTAANDQPAFAIYEHDPEAGLYRARAIQVLALSDGAVADVTTFGDPRWFAAFALPPQHRFAR